MTAPSTFNSHDPFDATAEAVRKLVCQAGLSAFDTHDYRNLTPQQQTEAVICGLTSGIASVAFAIVQPDARDDVIEFVGHYLDQAFQIAGSVEKADPEIPSPQTREERQ